MRREASSRPLFAFLKKALCEVESNGEHLSVNIFWYNSTWAYNKNKLEHFSETVGPGYA